MVVVYSFRDTNLPVWQLWWKIKTDGRNPNFALLRASTILGFLLSMWHLCGLFFFLVVLSCFTNFLSLPNVYYIWELLNRRWWCVPCQGILSSTNSPLFARGLGWVHPEKLNQRICTDYAHNLFAFLCSKLIYSRKAKLWYRFLLNYLGFLFRKRKIKQAKSRSIG